MTALRRLVADMAATMYEAPGVGLAASQVDVHERLIVIDISETKDALQVFINPEILSASDEQVECEEGCLSVPGIYDAVDAAGARAGARLRHQRKPFELDCSRPARRLRPA